MSINNDEPHDVMEPEPGEKQTLFPKLFLQRIEIGILSYINIILTSMLSLGLLLFLYIASGKYLGYCYGLELTTLLVLTAITCSIIFVQFSTINHNMILQKKFITIGEKKRIIFCFTTHVIFSILGWLMIILLVVFTSFIATALTTIEHKFSGTYGLSQIHANITIRREDSGMIHIEAFNQYDLFFGQGFVSAQNRLWQMEFQRRVGKGTFSEVVGKPGISVDKFTRTMDFYKSAENDFKGFDARTKNITYAFVDGINAYLALNAPLPFEFFVFGITPEKWNAIDVTVWGKLMSYDLSYNLRQEIERFKIVSKVGLERGLEIYPPYQRTDPTCLSASQLGITLTSNEINQIEDRFLNNTGAFIPKKSQFDFSEFHKNLDSLSKYLPSSLGIGEASNNWVFSGTKTTTGKPFLCNDPHLGLTSPAIWYMIHLVSPEIEVTGAALAGAPGIVIGKNRNIAWGITNLGADVQDLFALTEVNNGNSYMYKGVQTNYITTQEVIKVKSSAPITLNIKKSVFGPVINDVMGISGNPLALRWTTLDPNDDTFASILDLNFAQNWTQAKAAFGRWRSPTSNLVYADTDGNIGYHSVGQIPIRQDGHSGMLPVIGDGTYEWVGFIPHAELPQVFNPTEGYVITANNRVPPYGYKYHIAHDWVSPQRYNRIYEMANAKPTFSVEDMISFQMDVQSNLYKNLKYVFQTMNSTNTAWQTKLANWDGNESMISQEAMIFEKWLKYMFKLPEKEIGFSRTDLVWLVSAMKRNDSTCGIFHGKSCLQYAADSFDLAISDLTSEYNKIPKWGEVHTAYFPHRVFSQIEILNCLTSSATYAMGGTQTVNVAGSDDNFVTTHSASYRQIIDFSDYEKSKFIFAPGQDGNPLAPGYSNFIPLWRDGKYLSFENYKSSKTILHLHKK
eukprot:gene12295-5878_t